MGLGNSNDRQRSYRPWGRGGWKAWGIATKAEVTPTQAGSNNDIRYSARDRGTGGNSIRIRHVVSGASTPLSVSVSGSDVTVNVATDGSSAATSTADQVIAAITASAAASALLSAERAAGNNGTGVVAAFAYTNLTGGTDWLIA